MVFQKRTKKRSALKVLGSILTVLALLVLAEIILRLVLFGGHLVQKNPLSVSQIWHRNGIMTAYNEAASYVRFKPNRQSEDLNSFGFHSPEVPLEKAHGVRRIVFLGGSTTYDRGPLNQTYPHFVSYYLQRSGLNVDYVNAGGGGYTSTESLILYHLKAGAWNPDLVVFYNARNDLLVSANRFYSAVDLTDMWRPPYYETPPRFHQKLSRISKLYILLVELFGYHSFRNNNWDMRMRIDKRFAEEKGRAGTVDEFLDNIKSEEVLRVYRRNIEALALLTGNNNAVLLLVGFDFYPQQLHSVYLPGDRKLTSEEFAYLGHMIKAMNGILRETSERFPHVFFFELNGRISRNLFGDDCHLISAGRNEKGRLVAEYICAHKEEFGW
jgi:hypothetical protein